MSPGNLVNFFISFSPHFFFIFYPGLSISFDQGERKGAKYALSQLQQAIEQTTEEIRDEMCLQQEENDLVLY